MMSSIYCTPTSNIIMMFDLNILINFNMAFRYIYTISHILDLIPFYRKRIIWAIAMQNFSNEFVQYAHKNK